MNVSMGTDSLEHVNPIVLALFSSFFTWGGTALGAAMVFVFPTKTRKFLGKIMA